MFPRRVRVAGAQKQNEVCFWFVLGMACDGVGIAGNLGVIRGSSMADDSTSIVGLTTLKALSVNATKRSACFICIAGAEAGRMYKLAGDELVIGRVIESGIQVDDTGVSRRHAKIERHNDGSVEILDLGSTNGTYCNGERVERRMLQDGDKIQIGTTTILKFSFQDDLEEEFQRRQYESAVRDALTQAHNKKYFLERLPGDFAFAKRHGSVLSLAMMDIDFFKKVNDVYGHPAGDQVLKSVARIFLDSVRVDDVFARYGGEEFALIMRNTVPTDAAAATDRIRKKIASHVITAGEHRIQVTISVGIAAVTLKGPDTPEDLIGLADQQLYKAKRGGRNRVEVLL